QRGEELNENRHGNLVHRDGHNGRPCWCGWPISLRHCGEPGRSPFRARFGGRDLCTALYRGGTERRQLAPCCAAIDADWQQVMTFAFISHLQCLVTAADHAKRGDLRGGTCSAAWRFGSVRPA